MKRLVIIALGALGAACADDVPSTPSFQEHVAPILQANCSRCHLAGQRSALDSFRLTYTAAPVGPGGAGLVFDPPPDLPGFPRSNAELIASRVGKREMPPRIELRDEQIDTIVRWAEQGGERGPARPGNRAPVATVVESTAETVVIDIRDPDGDLVGGYLVENNLPTAEVTQGRNRITLVPGNRTISLHLDDGGAEFDLDLGVLP